MLKSGSSLYGIYVFASDKMLILQIKDVYK